MGLFSRKSPKAAAPPAPQGNGSGAMLLTFARGDGKLLIGVVGLNHYESAVRALAGRRPREDGDTYRQRNVKVRLVREPGNEYDPNAVAVHHDKAGKVGYVPRKWAADVGPALDAVLLRIGSLAQQSGDAVDIYCTAEVEAEWPEVEDLEPGDDKHEPESVSVTLILDGTWQAKPSRRKGM